MRVYVCVCVSYFTPYVLLLRFGHCEIGSYFNFVCESFFTLFIITIKIDVLEQLREIFEGGNYRR